MQPGLTPRTTYSPPYSHHQPLQEQASSGSMYQPSHPGHNNSFEQHLAQDQTPQPVLYIKSCSKCDWSSIPSYDPQAYAGAVSDYESHKKEYHPDPKDTGDLSSRSKDSEEYINATKPRKVEACEDDGVVNFCPVRFWRSPMSWKNAQLSLPLEQTPVCTVGDFEPFGIEVNNRSLLRDLHNRGYKSLKLKHFTDQNLTVVPSQQDTLLGFEPGSSGRLFTTKSWKEITSTKDAIKAASNYMELSRSIHPLDSGPQILFKVILTI